MDRPKVVIVSRGPSEAFLELVAEKFPITYNILIVPPEGLLGEVEDAVVLIPEHAPINKGLLRRAKRLRLVQCGAGYDYVDLEEASRRGIYVANAAGVNKRAVTEHVFALILTWAKKIISLNQSMRTGEWSKRDHVALELGGKTLGIVGLGHIGLEVAKRALAFEMRVLAVRRRPIVPRGLDIRLVDLDTLLRESDIVSLNTALTKEMWHMIGARELNLMKRDALLVNTARGAVVDEEALVEALRLKRIAGACLDVYSEEPLPAESPVRGLENVILTPHSAASTKEARENRYGLFAENTRRVIEGRVPLNVVNRPLASP
ncbi:MAG: NAD(P)-dependent oxidoreductase [Candidatus Bathyarchaeia archaeon]